MCDGQPVEINPKAFDLLLTLVNKHGQIILKRDLLDAVWEGHFVEEKNLAVHISALRKVFGERKDENRFIVTVPGKGYKFVAPLNIGAMNVSGELAQNPEIKEPKGTVRPGRMALYLVPIICLLAVVTFFALKNAGSKVSPIAVKRLTANGKVQLAVLSPDGRFFAYSTKESDKYRTEIRLGQVNGGNDVSLIPMGDTVYNPVTFSSDGSWLYYVETKPRERDNAVLYKVPVLGGVSQRLADGIGAYLAVSPDEKQLAFVFNDVERKISSLIVAGIDGSNRRTLVERPIAEAIHPLSLAWSPTGSLIAFGALAANSEGREIFLAGVSSGKANQLTSLNWTEFAKLEWLKDGTGLLAIGRDNSSKLLTQIWQIDYPSGTARAITSDVSKYGSALSVSGDSLGLLAVRGNPESNIWVAPAGNLKDARQVTFGSPGRQDGWNGLDWTSDGRIVYTAYTDQSSSIWIINVDGTNSLQLTPSGSHDIHLSVSPDSSFVVFESNRGGKKDIWSVRTDGSDLRQLTKDGGNSDPSLTPDGKWLVYEHSDNTGTSVWRLAMDGGSPSRLSSLDSVSPRVSPDGKYVACGYMTSSMAKLVILPIEGGEPVKLFEVPATFNFDNTAIRWSPDGRSINYRDWSNGIWQQSIDGGAPKRIENLPQEKLYTYGWSADGTQFSYVRGREIRDVVLINNFR